jgi:hypothetical protein
VCVYVCVRECSKSAYCPGKHVRISVCVCVCMYTYLVFIKLDQGTFVCVWHKITHISHDLFRVSGGEEGVPAGREGGRSAGRGGGFDEAVLCVCVCVSVCIQIQISTE